MNAIMAVFLAMVVIVLIGIFFDIAVFIVGVYCLCQGYISWAIVMLIIYLIVKQMEE